MLALEMWSVPAADDLKFRWPAKNIVPQLAESFLEMSPMFSGCRRRLICAQALQRVDCILHSFKKAGKVLQIMQGFHNGAYASLMRLARRPASIPMLAACKHGACSRISQ